MLKAQPPCGLLAPTVDTWVSPPVEEIPAPPPPAAGVTRGFLGGGAVVDHPDFVETGNAHDDLVEHGSPPRST